MDIQEALKSLSLICSTHASGNQIEMVIKNYIESLEEKLRLETEASVELLSEVSDLQRELNRKEKEWKKKEECYGFEAKNRSPNF